MNNTAKKNIIKHILLVFLLLVLYVLQSVPGLFVVRGIKPFLVIPAAIAIAMFEGEFAGGIYGAFAGLLCDIGGHLLFGFNGLVTSACCIAAGLFIIYLMRCNMFTFILFSAVTLILRGGVEYFFSYGMWDYENSVRIFTNFTLPAVLYSIIAGIPLFFLMRALHRRFPSFEGDEA